MTILRTALATAFAVAIGTSAMAQGGAQDGDRDVVALAEQDGEFGTLVEAIEAAGLTDALRGDGPFTVFAPTDEAFEALPEGALDQLMAEENRDQLAALLAYHVVPGQVGSQDLEGQRGMARTAAGSEALIDATGDEVRINQARVVRPDLAASNGVVHAIDAVVLPLEQPSGEGAEPGAEGAAPTPDGAPESGGAPAPGPQ